MLLHATSQLHLQEKIEQDTMKTLNMDNQKLLHLKNKQTKTATMHRTFFRDQVIN